ncbi:hypothetical protein OPV22_011778 [Ensete ventricosum]|uniref:Uncharacterized protein n=1 Tax=Ensete ventricosum TaxID=4639 RepID=A0AAV8RE87_ENSVE|nr:hypothetical protein OPV22_011778 [Ensete ventricosum]
MDANKCYIAALLILVILITVTPTTEASYLPDDETRGCRRCLMQGDSRRKETVLPVQGMAASPPVEVEADASPSVENKDVRPTTPGHSPGVGHALHGKGVGKSV